MIIGLVYFLGKKLEKMDAPKSGDGIVKILDLKNSCWMIMKKEFVVWLDGFLVYFQ